MKYEVKLFNAIAPVALKKLNSFGIKEGAADIVIARSAELKKDQTINDSMVVARAGVGVNNIPVDRLSEKLIPVVYAPGGNADSVCELTVGKVIDACKKTIESTEFVKKFEGTPEALEDLKKAYKGIQLRGSSVCVLGMGNIGTRVAYILSQMGMKVYWKVNDTKPEYIEKHLVGCNGVLAKKVLEMYSNKASNVKVMEKIQKDKVEEGDIIITNDETALYAADIISTHIGAQKKPVFDGNFFKKAKKGVIIVNTDRGQLVDEAAMLKALEDKVVAAYHTDFAPADLKLRKHSKVFSSPHTAASTDAAEDNCANMVVDSILSFVFEGNMTNSKNFPEVVLARKGKSRMIVAGNEINEAKIAEVLKANKLSVVQQKKGKKGKLQYAIFDLAEANNESYAKIAKQISKDMKVKARFVPTNDKLNEKATKEEAAKPKPKKTVYNFSAGPAVLPKFVVDGVRKDMAEFKDTGMSVAEMSHRDKPIMNMLKETEDLVKKALKVPEGYQILFLQGGATLQFSMLPINMSKKGDKIGFFQQGAWSKKALQDAKICEKLGLCGTPVVLSTNEDCKAKHMPKVPAIPQDLKYLHVCSNETIHGIEWRSFPESGKVPMVVDMSSNIFSHPIDWKKNIGCIYAGAQKNSGMAGVTLLIMRKDLIDAKKALPNYLKMSNHSENDSEYNTPPVVAILSMNYMMKWLQQQGGVENMEKIVTKKANLLYDFFAQSKGFYITRVDVKEERSRMNVVWNLKTEKLEDEFLAEATKKGFIGLKGHRDLKGIRASIYNAFPEQGILDLIAFMKDFQQRKDGKKQ